jgi:hypothetical protein
MSEVKHRLPRQFTEEKWLPALRSGKYKQTQNHLQTETFDEEGVTTGTYGYCCLGLAGHLCGISDDVMDNVGMFHLDRDETDRDYHADVVAKATDYPKELYYVEKHPDGSFIERKVREEQLASVLATMNDEGSTFAHIADWITTNVELYD